MNHEIARIDNYGVSGQTVALAAAAINSVITGLASEPELAHSFLLNWGAVELISGSLPAEATWNNNYLAILDAINTAYPEAKVYLARPWKQGQDALAATLKTRIDTIVAARSSFAAVGPDEAVWLKGADDGATMTSDGVHYSTAGKNECAAQWRVAVFP